MSTPFLLIQLSDPHIGADWGVGDPVAKLERAIEGVRALESKPGAVLVSGDLTDKAADGEYLQLRGLLAALEAPVHVLPGNHDDRAALRRNFGVPGVGGEFVQYAADLGPLRLVVIDTTRPGEDRGELDAERLGWLDGELAAAPQTPTVLAMHHTPLATGIPVWDAIGLPVADRRELGRVVERHPQVKRLVGGHFHRTIAGDLGGRAVLAAPSTYVQAELDFRLDQIELSTQPAGFVAHAFVDGEVFSHVQPVA
jgi:3',5'-cyclic-AMP phosphodiesterase